MVAVAAAGGEGDRGGSGQARGSGLMRLRFDGGPSRSGAGFAGDPAAALADVAGAAAPHAGLLDDRRRPAVVLRKSLAEFHCTNPCRDALSETEPDIIDPTLRRSGKIA